jgi:hypothetical protein
MKNAYLSEKLYDDEQSQLDFFEYLTTMMMYQEKREEEPKPPKIEKMESLLSDQQKKVNFFKGLGLKKEPSGEAGAPVLTLGDKPVKAELYQEKNKNSASDGTGMVKVLSSPSRRACQGREQTYRQGQRRRVLHQVHLSDNQADGGDQTC